MGRGSITRQYLEALGLALVLVFLIRVFAVQAFRIPSTSMVPTLLVGDHLLVSKLHYGLRLPWGGGWLATYARPRVGDVVVFVPPGGRGGAASASRAFVKRVVAVEGEVVEIRDGQVFVNGQVRDAEQAHAAPGGMGARSEPAALAPRRLESGQVFVLGDQRSFSRDSRDWGPIDIQDVEGKAVFVYWSWDPRAQRIRWERIGDVVR
jgi:signal peptidase I